MKILPQNITVTHTGLVKANAGTLKHGIFMAVWTGKHNERLACIHEKAPIWTLAETGCHFATFNQGNLERQA